MFMACLSQISKWKDFHNLGIMGIGSHSKAAAVNIMINFYYLGFVISLFCWWTS